MVPLAAIIGIKDPPGGMGGNGSSNSTHGEQGPSGDKVYDVTIDVAPLSPVTSPQPGPPLYSRRSGPITSPSLWD